MKKGLLFLNLLILGLLISFSGKAQDKEVIVNDASTWVDQMINPDGNFYQAKRNFDIYWGERDVTDKHVSKGKGYKVFLRWQDFMAPRVFPSGQKMDPSIVKNEYQKFLKNNPSKSVAGNWSLIGPKKPTGTVANGSYQSPGGAGRVNAIAFHPTNSSIIYIGTPAGGFWKSTDGGTNWTCTTDQNAVLGVSAIVVDPNNPNTIYIGTGDGDAGDTYSIGVLKSTDGGNTWVSTGFAQTVNNKWVIRRMVIDPSNSNKMYAATNKGLVMTTDGWATYTTAISGSSFYDVELKPGTSTTVYAVGVASKATKFYVSTDGGTTFNLAGTSLPSTDVQRVSIAVSAAAPANVWALAGKASDQGFLGLYVSTNSGTSFTTKYSSGTNKNLLGWEANRSDAGGQAFYDLALAVNPSNANEVFVGGVNLHKSTDGGATWACNGYWLQGAGYNYIHADHHALEFQNGTTLYDGCDGGIFKTSNNGTAWSDLSTNLAIAQVAAFGTSSTNKNLIMTGMQDNGTNKWNGTTWSIVYGGDGCETFAEPGNDNNVYASYVQGALYRSTNGGSSWSSCRPTSTAGEWITPFVMDPSNPANLYAGYAQLYKSTNRGVSWTQKGTTPGSGNIFHIAVAPSAPTTVYVLKTYYNSTNGTTTFTVAKTTNDGTAWTSIGTGLPLTTAAPTYFAISPTDANKVWLTFSGYAAGEKVYYSSNGGSTWTNVSGNLPNIPANCIVYQKNSADGLYVGTDVGVYYKDNNTTDWVLFNNGLPNVIIKELEIYYDNTTPANSRLRAATYGRSVWESDLYSGVVIPVLATVTTGTASATQTTATVNGNVTSDGNATITERGVVYSTTANPTTSNSKVTVTGTTGSFTANLSGLTANTTYYAKAYAINSVGTAYGSEISFTTSATATAPTVTTGTVASIAQTTATAAGNVTADGGATITERGIVYSTSANPTTANSKVTASGTTGSFTANLSGLTANTTYYVKAYAINSVGTSYGTETSFTTLPIVVGYSIPFTQDFASSTMATDWTTQNTGTSITERWSVSATTNAGGVANEMKCTYQQVNPGTTRLVTPAINTTGYNSLTLTFKHMLDAYATGATLKVQTSTDGTNWTDAWTLATGSTNVSGTVTVNLTTNLNSSSTKVAFVVTGDLYQIDAWYIDNVSITAPAATTVPTVTTTAASTITSTGATTGGNVTSDGGSAITERGVVYSTTATPTTANTKVTATGTTGAYTSTLSGLTANTTYYVRAYAINANGTSYGSEVSFTTLPTTITYCASKGTTITYEWIDLVQLGTINNTTAANAGYGDFTAQSTNIGLNGSYTIYFSAGFKSTAYTEYFKVYIDYNKDGDFVDAGENVVSGSSSASTTLSGTFTVPATATLGATRMRVVMSDNSATTSCNSYSYGETEDYTVNITSTPVAQHTAINAETIGNEDFGTFVLYPNPANDLINISLPENTLITVDIYTIAGIKVKNVSVMSNEGINISDLASGNYSLVISDGQKIVTRKFVKY